MAAVFSRYARALADVVLSMNLEPTTTVDQVNAVVALVESSPDLRRVWESPAIPSEEKRELLDSIASRMELHKAVRNFTAVLIDNHRIAALPQIAKQFEIELHQRLGMADVDVTSSRELSAEERRDIESQVELVTGKKVRAKYGIDPALIGGAVIRMGSTVYDGSVRGQLQQIKEQLMR